MNSDRNFVNSTADGLARSFSKDSLRTQFSDAMSHMFEARSAFKNDAEHAITVLSAAFGCGAITLYYALTLEKGSALSLESTQALLGLSAAMISALGYKLCSTFGRKLLAGYGLYAASVINALILWESLRNSERDPKHDSSTSLAEPHPHLWLEYARNAASRVSNFDFKYEEQEGNGPAFAFRKPDSKSKEGAPGKPPIGDGAPDSGGVTVNQPSLSAANCIEFWVTPLKLIPRGSEATGSKLNGSRELGHIVAVFRQEPSSVYTQHIKGIKGLRVALVVMIVSSAAIVAMSIVKGFHNA